MTTRRRFLTQLAAGAAGMTMGSRAWASTPVAKRKERLGVALVGLGYYSTDLLAPALQLTAHCRLAGVVSGTPSKLAAWQQRHRLPDAGLYDYATFDTIANNPEIDVVYIVLPPSMHAE